MEDFYPGEMHSQFGIQPAYDFGIYITGNDESAPPCNRFLRAYDEQNRFIQSGASPQNGGCWPCSSGCQSQEDDASDHQVDTNMQQPRLPMRPVYGRQPRQYEDDQAQNNGQGRTNNPGAYTRAEIREGGPYRKAQPQRRGYDSVTTNRAQEPPRRNISDDEGLSTHRHEPFTIIKEQAAAPTPPQTDQNTTILILLAVIVVLLFLNMSKKNQMPFMMMPPQFMHGGFNLPSVPQGGSPLW